MNTLTMNRKRGRTENEDDGGAAAAVTPSVQPSKKTKFGTLIKKDKRQILTEPHPDDNPNSKHEDTSRLHGDEDGGGGSAVVSEDPMAQDMGQLSDEVGEAPHDVKKVSKVKKVLQAEKLKRLKEDYDRRGVVYVSRIPPHMKPMKLKQLLSQYGETLRVYCAPEDPRARKMRKKKGGNTGKNFTEGWVEFADKRIAKRVANAINGQKIGGKRRSAYYDDLWCVKYLKHFKWDHLTEEIAYQKAVHEQKLAAELSAAKRERDHYLAQVDKAKGLAAMAERREAKAAQAGQDGVTAPAARPKPEVQQQQQARQPTGEGQGGPRIRHFGQRQPKADPTSVEAATMADDVLMMVARKKSKRKAAE